MTYKDIQTAIALLKKQVKCKRCNRKVSNDRIFIQKVAHNHLKAHCTCQTCDEVVIADLKLLPTPPRNLNELYNTDRKQKNIKLYKKSKEKSASISVNEVLDLKNFLKDFKGDFKDIF